LRKSKCCKFCGTKENLTIDHIKPLAFGGSHNPNNLRILCRSCHDKRHGIKTTPERC